MIMRSSKRAVTLIACVGLTGLLLAGIWSTLRTSPSPLEHAQAVSQTTYWLPERGRRGEYPLYYWSAGNRVTYFGVGKDGASHLFQMSTPRTDAPDREGPTVNVRNGFAEQLSSDGKWFVDWRYNALHQYVPIFVSTEGTRRITGQPTDGMEHVWAPGDRPAMYCNIGHGNITVGVYHPDASPVQKIVIPGLLHFYAPQRVDPSGRLVGFEDGAFFQHYAPGEPGTSLNYPFTTMARLDPAHPTHAPEEWKVPVPENVDEGMCLLSPSGDHILWIVRGDSSPALVRKLKSFISGQRAAGRVRYHWLVSDLKGANLHEIAGYPFDDYGKGGKNPYSSPCWLPDSRHISFIFNNTLYTRPVE